MIKLLLLLMVLSLFLPAKGQKMDQQDEHNFKIAYQIEQYSTYVPQGDSEDTGDDDSSIIKNALDIAAKYLHDLLFLKNQDYDTNKFNPTEEDGRIQRDQNALKKNFTELGADLFLTVEHHLLPVENLGKVLIYSKPWYTLEGSGPKIALLLISLRLDGMESSLKTKLIFQGIVGAILNLFNNPSKWIDSQTGLRYQTPTIIEKLDSLTSQKIELLSTPNVLQVAKEHFNCKELEGLLINNSGTRIAGFWDSYLIKNDYLIIREYTETKYMNKFTFAFLRDTGYFTSLNETMLESYSYGQNLGCDLAAFRETMFVDHPKCKSEIIGKIQCNYEGYDTFTCEQFDLPSKKFIQESEYISCEYHSFLAKLPQYNDRCLLERKNFGNQEELVANCYQAKCINNNQLLIKDNGNEYVCQANRQIILTTEGSSIECPQNLESFCGFKACSNNCLGKGYCLNGECQCLQGELCQ